MQQSQRMKLYKGCPWLNSFLNLITPPLHNLRVCLAKSKWDKKFLLNSSCVLELYPLLCDIFFIADFFN